MIDVGRDVPVGKIIAKLIEVNADMIGTSALLTTTLVEQQKFEEKLWARGLRDKFKAIVGGAFCTVAGLAQYYLLPSWVEGGQADSKRSDTQTAHETALLTALGGANVIYEPGMLEPGVTYDYAQLLIDNRIARMVNKVVEGILINDDILAVDLSKEVKSSSGQFVTNIWGHRKRCPQ